MLNLNNVGIKNQGNKSLPYSIHRGKVCLLILKITLFMKYKSLIYILLQHKVVLKTIRLKHLIDTC